MPIVRLALAGPHTIIGSSACRACPHAPAGCCTGPPPFDWSDVGRVASLGGRDWLLEELAAGRLRATQGGLEIKKRSGRARPGGPRVAKCVYHGEGGCTITHDRRPALCNYYVCESALEGARDAARARATHAELAGTYARWDQELASRLARERAALADGEESSAPLGLDAARLDWLAAAFDELAAASAKRR